ncbi:hypothetical protein H9Q69_014235 [Fusarium xylarioides]|uniref:Uncharacterized protein n=1 Tax=Fusarium xylarioides TaxID=221167 RepID=A0A9P7L9N4_9HYPO|nr:hypothetical protein H9Q72_002514 [Fusarium xylarioides]KAG5782980.1 hypothetical protein H9Q73_003387 [Fusarium xylarioides]KAG5786685.1 hypothetical protein H9Q69_014235 [Fusarium xylarioides]KAG5801996.1 hypothetical protein H9Q71_013415 [Fusarium xylarioides]KAG5814456.1 hypothetical protein H9Q74_012249 [Fusarium xylarioides]
MDEEEEHYDFMYQGWVAHMGEMLHRDMSHVIAEIRAHGRILPVTDLSPRSLWYPHDYDLFLPLDMLPQVDAEEVAVISQEDEENSVVKAEPGSPDTLAAPESPRSPDLYDIPPFRRSQTPSPVNLEEAAVDSPQNEATVTIKPQPSPETDDDVVEVPRSPGCPSLYDIPRFYATPDLSPPQPSPEDMERPIPSRAPSPRTSPQRNTLGGRINGHGIRRNLQFFINRGNQRRAINHAQMLRRRLMQEERFGLRQYQRHVEGLQRQHEQRLRDGENAPCNTIPVSRGRRFHGAPRFVERFSVRDAEDSGRLSPYDFY